MEIVCFGCEKTEPAPEGFDRTQAEAHWRSLGWWISGPMADCPQCCKEGEEAWQRVLSNQKKDGG